MVRQIARTTLAFALAPLLIALRPANGEDKMEKQRAEDTLRLATNEARSYDIFVGKEPRTKLKLSEKSILRWSNPITGAYGEVFLWTKSGRPLVIASVYQYYLPDRYLAVAFQSLAPDRLSATRGSEEAWYPGAAGVEFRVLSEAPRPAASKSERLAQMRALARDFQVRFTTPENEREWLRLLSHPNYRYQCEGEQLLDGSIFIFTQGTTPTPSCCLRRGERTTATGGISRWLGKPVIRYMRSTRNRKCGALQRY